MSWWWCGTTLDTSAFAYILVSLYKHLCSTTRMPANTYEKSITHCIHTLLIQFEKVLQNTFFVDRKMNWPHEIICTFENGIDFNTIIGTRGKQIWKRNRPQTYYRKSRRVNVKRKRHQNCDRNSQRFWFVQPVYNKNNVFAIVF